jgi:S1-C subfamily serine protease
MRQNGITQAALFLSFLMLPQLYIAKSSFAEPLLAIEADAKMVENCKFLGSVEGSSFWGIKERTMKDALKRAAEKGATHVVFGELIRDIYGTAPHISGKAYLCDQGAIDSQGTALQQIPSTNPSSVQNQPNLYKVAEETTVLIEGQNTASGVIISKVGKIYYVLTAKHAVATQDAYTVLTSLGKKYSVDYKQVKKLANIDLAVISFTSDQSYPVAPLGNSDQIKQGDSVYVSGWPGTGQAITKRTHLLTDGRIVGLQTGDSDGYELMYGNSTAPGMSGGPVFDKGGRVVGIHGRAAGNQVSGKVGINLGIPINLFLRLGPVAGLDFPKLGLRTEKIK